VPFKRRIEPGPTQDIAWTENLKNCRDIAVGVQLQLNLSFTDQVEPVSVASFPQDKVSGFERYIPRKFFTMIQKIAAALREEWMVF
jgi:hypothetical protein